MSNFIKVLKRDIVSIGIVFGLSAIGYLVIAFFSSDIRTILNGLVTPLICFPVASAYLFKLKGFSPQKLVYPDTNKISANAILYIIMSVSVMMGMSFLIGLTSKLFNIVSSNNSVQGLPTWFLIILTCIIAPISEEIFFRAALSSVSSEQKNASEDLLAAFLFSAFHFSILHFPYYLVLSLICTYGVRRYGSLWISIIIHAVLNLIMVLIML